MRAETPKLKNALHERAFKDRLKIIHNKICGKGLPANSELFQLVDRSALARLLADLETNHFALMRFGDGLVIRFHGIYRLLKLGAVALNFNFVADPQTAGKLNDSHADLAVVVGDFADLGHMLGLYTKTPPR